MRKVFTVFLIAFAASVFAQEVPFTENEIILLRAAKPLYRERAQLQQDEIDYAGAQAALDHILTKLNQANNLKANWEARGKDTTIIDIVILMLENDRDLAQERVDTPVDNSVRIAELTSLLSEFLDLLLEIAPEGRLRADYLDFVQ